MGTLPVWVFSETSIETGDLPVKGQVFDTGREEEGLRVREVRSIVVSSVVLVLECPFESSALDSVPTF